MTKPRIRFPHLIACLAAATLGCATAPTRTAERDLRRCDAPYRMLTEGLGMAAEVTADTVADWRTHLSLPGCRITAAGSIADASETEQAEAFFNSVRDAGWTRTPDPRDMPNESAIRFRLNDTDCFFNRYLGIMIGTPAEMRVNGVYQGRPGDDRFNVLVQCVEALPAFP